MMPLLRSILPALVVVGYASAAVAAQPNPDPWEKFNRKIFWFNEKADQYVLEPVAKGWDFVVPEFAQTGIRNAFTNLAHPIYFANHLLQWRPRKAGQDIVRLVVNSTVGVAGLIDVATMEGIEMHDTGFGLTLARWGVPKGPYLVVPVFGAATPRQAVGLAADTTAAGYSYFVPVYASVSVATVRIINQRSIFLEQIDMEREGALDFYVFVRDAYLQNLRSREWDADGLPPAVEDDLYYFDEEFDDDLGTDADEYRHDASVEDDSTGDGFESQRLPAEDEAATR